MGGNALRSFVGQPTARQESVFERISTTDSPGMFTAALILYALVLVTRINESLPFLTQLYLGKVSALLLLVTAYFQMDRRMGERVLSSTTARCVIVITILAALSIPGSYWPHESVTFFRNEWPQTLLLFFCVAIGFTNLRVADRVLAWLLLGTALAAGRVLLGSAANMGGRVYISSATSATYDPNESAALFVMMLPVAMMFFQRATKFRWLALGTMPVLLMATLKTGSRGGILALGALFVVVFATGTGRQRWTSLLLLAVAGAVYSAVPHDELSARFVEAFSGGGDYNRTSRDGRLQIWQRGVGLMFSHPLLGVGAGAYEIANGVSSGSWKAAHNAYLEIGVELGLGGLAAFLIAIWCALRAAWITRVLRSDDTVTSNPTVGLQRQLSTASFACLVTLLVAAIFLSLAYSSMLMFALGAATGLRLACASVADRSSSGAGRTGTVVSRGAPGWRTAPNPLRSRSAERA